MPRVDGTWESEVKFLARAAPASRGAGSRTVREDDVGIGEGRRAVEGVGPVGVGQRVGLVKWIDVEDVPALLQVPARWTG